MRCHLFTLLVSRRVSIFIPILKIYRNIKICIPSCGLPFTCFLSVPVHVGRSISHHHGNYCDDLDLVCLPGFDDGSINDRISYMESHTQTWAEMSRVSLHRVFIKTGLDISCAHNSMWEPPWLMTLPSSSSLLHNIRPAFKDKSCILLLISRGLRYNLITLPVQQPSYHILGQKVINYWEYIKWKWNSYSHHYCVPCLVTSRLYNSGHP